MIERSVCKMEVNKAERNWFNYVMNNVGYWRGMWVSWDPHTGEVIKCHHHQRYVEALDVTKTHIRHQNTFIYENGEVLDSGPFCGPFLYTMEDAITPTGISHPSEPRTRALFFENGCGICTFPEHKNGKFFFSEFFFPRGDRRTSCVVVYNATGNIYKASHVREDQMNRSPSPYWSTNRELEERRDFPEEGAVTGVERVLSSGLELSEPRSVTWSLLSDNENDIVLYCPDNVTIVAPMHVKTEEPFRIKMCVICEFNGKKELHELISLHVNGVFTEVRQRYFVLNQ